MRLKLAPVALFALSMLVGAAWILGSPANAWAKGGKGNSDKKGSDEALNRQFKWEEGVVGANDKKLDREKIAAMQERARKEDAAHKNEPAKKAERPKGVGVPATSTLPTMDIEKPAPVAAKPKQQPRPMNAEPPKRRDSLDQLLDSEKDAPAPQRGHRGDGGLGKVLAVGDSSGSSSSDEGRAHDGSATKTKGKHVAHRR